MFLQPRLIQFHIFKLMKKILSALLFFFCFFGFCQNEQLANNYFDRGEFEKALVSYEELLKSQEGNFNYFQRTIECYQQLQQFEKAQNDFKKAHLLDTLDYTVYHYQYKHYVLKGELDSAIMAINSAIKIDPNDPEHYYNLAKIFERQGKNSLAIKMSLGLPQ